MSFSPKGTNTNDTKLNKPTTLNPNATEFVPLALRLPTDSSIGTDVKATFVSSETTGKSDLERSESSVTIDSDEEARQYWSHKLPDDITFDFSIVGEDESQGNGNLSLAGLSLHNGNETSRYTTIGRTGNGFQEFHPPHINGNIFTENSNFPISSYGEDKLPVNLPHKPWDKQILNTDSLIGNGHSRHGHLKDIFSENAVMEGKGNNPLELLAKQFPGIAAESLANVYFANQCDLHLTIAMLSRLELQVDGGLYPISPNTSSARNLTATDFHALPVRDGKNVAHKIFNNANPYRSSLKENTLMPSRGATDYASFVKEMALQESNLYKYDRSGLANGIGSIRSNNALASSYNNGYGRAFSGEKLQNGDLSHAVPTWLETGEAVGNLYSELREEARDHARAHNAFVEQARRSYLIGNKALAKDLSMEGQLHNMRIKATHGQAQDSIYRQRNPSGPMPQGNGRRGIERMIDLQGLHLSEAMAVLKDELSLLRTAARSVNQPIYLYISVGSDHRTHDTYTPARRLLTVQRYLLEEEGLDFTEPKPGVLRVVIY